MSLPRANASHAGVALMIVMVWLLIVTLLSISAARLGLQDRKALQGMHDRVTAFQAAEAALLDGESDLDGSAAGNAARHAIFQRQQKVAILHSSGAPCQTGPANAAQGLCRAAVDAELPAWLAIDLADRTDDAAVPYGRFTGQSMQTGAGALPRRLPRYLIETLTQQRAPGSGNVYRITAIGFGAREDNHVVLQSLFNAHWVAGAGPPAEFVGTTPRVGRLSWREISNWSEMRQQLLRDSSRP